MIHREWSILLSQLCLCLCLLTLAVQKTRVRSHIEPLIDVLSNTRICLSSAMPGILYVLFIIVGARSVRRGGVDPCGRTFCACVFCRHGSLYQAQSYLQRTLLLLFYKICRVETKRLGHRTHDFVSKRFERRLPRPFFLSAAIIAFTVAMVFFFCW